MKESRIFRYRIDIISVMFVFVAIGVQFTAFFLDWPWYTMILILFLIRQTNLVEHNHAHLGIFHQTFLNEALGFLCFYSNGTPYEFYKIHHVRNHHAYNQKFDDVEKDWSSLFGFTTAQYPDKPVSRLYYVLSFPVITICQSLIEILRAPDSKIFRRFVRSMILLTIVSAGLIYLSPLNFLFFFFLPWVIVSFGLGDNNYSHHYGCELTDPYNSSNVFTGYKYQFLGFFIGYHVAHHIKPNLHWSLLPEYHNTIKENIPAENYRPSKYSRREEPKSATTVEGTKKSKPEKEVGAIIETPAINGAIIEDKIDLPIEQTIAEEAIVAQDPEANSKDKIIEDPATGENLRLDAGSK